MRINRIRLEFKDNTTGFLARNPMVLIESDWNLKFRLCSRIFRKLLVLIESDWNLKVFVITGNETTLKQVLIESDWNLKFIFFHVMLLPSFRINRIRLEFKAVRITHASVVHSQY